MTLTLNQSTTIRPLGEEHLRMFRRTIKEEEAAPRISLSKEAPQKIKVSLSKKRVVDEEEACRAAKRLGGRLATAMEVVMDLRVVNDSLGECIIIDWRGLPKAGWYYVDRKRKKLEPVSEAKAGWLKEQNRIHIIENAFAASQERRPIEFCYTNSGTGGDHLLISEIDYAAGPEKYRFALAK